MARGSFQVSQGMLDTGPPDWGPKEYLKLYLDELRQQGKAEMLSGWYAFKHHSETSNWEFLWCDPGEHIGLGTIQTLKWDGYTLWREFTDEDFNELIYYTKTESDETWTAN